MSKYNKFVKSYMKKNLKKGDDVTVAMKKAAKEWKKVSGK